MKNLLPALSFVALSAASAHAQDIAGIWQGTLQAGRDLRVVIKVSKGNDGLRAVLFSIDQGGQGFAASTVTLQGSTVNMSIPGIGGAYEGKLNADGTTITGTWSQGPGRLPLNLVRATTETAWAIPASPDAPKAMAANATVAFEVATIKPSKPEAQGKLFTIRGRQFVTVNTSLSDLMTFAYGLHPRQIVGGPGWLDTERYDVLAKPDGDGQPSDTQWKVMMQKLLAERFKLTFHRDTRELAVYAIVINETGPKLTKSAGDPNGLPSLLFRGLGVLTGSNASVADLAGVMQMAVLDRPVIDRTGLSGKYDFMLTWTPDEFQFGGLGIKVPPPNGTATAPDLFTAFREQLGLKLEAAKAPAAVFVIDGAEKPSDN